MIPSRLLLQAERVIFSGIQPTGIPHLGNYLGALKNWVRLQNSAQNDDALFYSIVGLHAITLPQDAQRLRRERRETFATLLAVGLDPQKCTIFHQDQVHEHAELAWILNCMTPVGKLFRMTTWKSRLADSRNANSSEEVSDSLLQLGLLAYPVLQAADVLLYKQGFSTTEVPVGEDQHQHIELTRDIAQAFNSLYNTSIFTLPSHTSTPQARIASLRNPAQKMSKSHPDIKSRILLTDPPDVIISKLKGAVTDSTMEVTENWQDRPGIRNLFTIMAGLRDVSIDECVKEYQGKNAGQLKKDLGEVVIETLKPIQQSFGRLIADEAHLRATEELGRSNASHVARRTLSKVKDVIGL